MNPIISKLTDNEPYVRVPTIKCPRCPTGKIFRDADGDRTCVNCGYTIYSKPLPLVGKDAYHGETNK